MNWVVFVSEMGEGLGHMSRRLPVAKRIKLMVFSAYLSFHIMKQHSVRFKMQDFVIPGSPVWMAPLKSGQTAKSLGDIIGRVDFADFHKLSFNLKAWDSIFRVLAPN